MTAPPARIADLYDRPGAAAAAEREAAADPASGRVNPGARLAAIVSILIIAIYGFRMVAGLTSIGGGFTYMPFTASCSRR